MSAEPQLVPHAQQARTDRTVEAGIDGPQSGSVGAGQRLPLALVYGMWILTVFEVDLYLTWLTGVPFYRVPPFVAAVLVLSVLFRGDRRALYWPMVLFTLQHVGASIWAENAGLSRGALKFMVYMLVLLAGSVTFLASPSNVTLVLKLYLLSFAWYGFQGLPDGSVPWHRLLANEDSYGPLMVIGLVFAYFFALATSSRGWRWLARVIFGLGVLGVVVSLARGASLAAGTVLLYILLRSKQGLRTVAVFVLAGILLLPVASWMLPLDKYIAEIGTVSEGDEVRTTLWRLGWNVFQESPLIGVGAFNFGVRASRITPFDAARAVRSDPAQLYFFTMHNAPMQILSEEGIVGITLWIAMIVGFFRRVRRLQSERAGALWRQRGGRDLDLRMIARGLEGAMVGYLVNSAFYNQIYIHWFWSLIILSLVLAALTARDRDISRSPRGASSAGTAAAWSG